MRALWAALLLLVGPALIGAATGEGAAQPAPEQGGAQEVVEPDLTLDQEAGQLAGTYAWPEGEAPWAAALLLAGSGPTDRDGNQPGLENDSLRQLALGLAARGIGTLRFDKRGVGESADAAPAEEELRFGTYVRDGLMWLIRLREEAPDAPIFLIGHSEGALVATMMAQEVDVDGLVLLAPAGERATELIRRQLPAAGLSREMMETAEATLQSLEAGEQVADVPEELAALFRPSVQPYLISWFAMDPRDELQKLDKPALVVHGSNDLQAGLDGARRLAEASPKVELTVIDGVNHVLKPAPPDRQANLATYARTDPPVDKRVTDAVAEFVRRHAAR